MSDFCVNKKLTTNFEGHSAVGQEVSAKKENQGLLMSLQGKSDQA